MQTFEAIVYNSDATQCWTSVFTAVDKRAAWAYAIRTCESPIHRVVSVEKRKPQ